MSRQFHTIPWTAGLSTAAAVGLLVIVCGPLFVCMPLTSDVVLYDLQARNLVDGGILYRDIFETNLPGIVWIHAAVRSFIGPTSEAIRLFDLTVVTTIILLLIRQRTPRTPSKSCATGGLLLLFYFSTNEWCHCQRDIWMLLPCLVAFGLRKQNLARLCNPAASLSRAGGGNIVVRAMVEGMVWAVAFWIKPHIVLPAAACWVVSALIVNHPRRSMLDLIGVIAGAVLIIAAGIGWLVTNDAWPWLIDTFRDWNPEYLASGRSRWTFERLFYMTGRLHPWIWLHVPAVCVSVRQLVRFIRRPRPLIVTDPASADDHPATERTIERTTANADHVRLLLAAFYLGWLAQSILLQHLMDYIHVPAIMIGIAVLAATDWRIAVPIRNTAVVGFALLSVLLCPLLRPHKLACWPQCVTSGTSSVIRDRLSDATYPDWLQMERVIEFLRHQDLVDGQLTCYNVHSIHIYDQLNLRPSTRYFGLASLIDLFPGHNDEIRQALERSHQRLIVTELIESGMHHQDALAIDPNAAAKAMVPPPAYPKFVDSVFPWSHPVIFRAGRYLVHRATPDVGRVTGHLP